MAARSGPSQPSGSARTENAGDLLEGLGIGSGVPVSHRLSGVSSGWPLRFDADVVSVPDETQGHRGFDLRTGGPRASAEAPRPCRFVAFNPVPVIPTIAAVGALVIRFPLERASWRRSLDAAIAPAFPHRRPVCSSSRARTTKTAKACFAALTKWSSETASCRKPGADAPSSPTVRNSAKRNAARPAAAAARR